VPRLRMSSKERAENPCGGLMFHLGDFCCLSW
jgi:hypothetical protein